MLLLVALVATIVGARADLSLTREAYYGTKGGHGSQGRDLYSQSADMNRALFGNTNISSFGFDAFSHTRRNLETEPGVGVCFVEVPTASLVGNPSQVPQGNGSRPDLSRIRSCCAGYTRNIYNHLLCDPVCSKGCHNANCVAPETCTCFPDHVKNAADFCVATCPIGCQNGHCAGSTCRCNDGFTLDVYGKYCLPKCDESCGGSGIGNCTAPNTCTCKPGYTSTPSGSCRQSGSYNPLQNNIYNQNNTTKPLYPNLNQGNSSDNPYYQNGQNPYGQYPNQNGQYPNGPYPNQMGQNPNGQYPNQNGQNPNRPFPNQMGHNPNGQYPNQNGQYPNGPYPNQMGQNPNGQYPNQNGQNPNGPFPNQIGQNPNGQYPNQNGRYPEGQYYPNQQGQNSNGQYPNQNNQYPNQNNPYITTDIHHQRNFSSDSLTTSQVNVGISNHSMNLSNYPNQGNQNYQPGQNPGQYPDQNQYSPNQYWEQIPTGQQVNENLVPRCSQPCINGVCVTGNRCSCNPGFELDSADPSGTRCRPRCPGGCQNGSCTAPNFCICDVGYRKEQGVKGGAARCIKRQRRSVLDMLV